MNMIAPTHRELTIDLIKATVAATYDIEVRALSADRRHAKLARARQVAMWLAAKLTLKSTSVIGRAFGGRDHTTVLHALARVDGLIVEDQAFAALVHGLRRQLEEETAQPHPTDLLIEDLTESFRRVARHMARTDPEGFFQWATTLIRREAR